MPASRFSSTLTTLVLLTLMLSAGGCSKDDAPTTPVNPGPGTVNDTLRPIVFVHGMLEAADAWIPMSQLALLNNVPENFLHAPDFELVTAAAQPDVPGMAAQLAARVEAVLASTRADRVDVIAHGAGAQAVQHYLTRGAGLTKVAHVAFLGPIIDPALTAVVNGSATLTPGPVKYLTIRSNGQDATQNSPDDGTIAGADNRQIPDLDHQELLASGTAYGMIHRFFTGQTAGVTKLPRVQLLRSYPIKGRVLSMYDNTPVPGATVSFWYIGSSTKGRQSNGTWRTVTADAQGYFSFTDTLRPISKLEVLVKAPNHYESHYFKTEWRETTLFERYRLMPRSGGSSYLSAVRSGLNFDSFSTIAILQSPYQALYSNRDQIEVRVDTAETTERIVQIINARTAPIPGAAGPGKNVWTMFLFDHGGNRTDGGGPVPVPALDTWGISSFDVHIDAERASLFSTMTANAKSIYFQNFRSGGTLNNGSGLTFIRYDYFDDAK